MSRFDRWRGFVKNTARASGLLLRGAARARFGDELGATRDTLEGVDALAEGLACLGGEAPPPEPAP